MKTERIVRWQLLTIVTLIRDRERTTNIRFFDEAPNGTSLVFIKTIGIRERLLEKKDSVTERINFFSANIER